MLHTRVHATFPSELLVVTAQSDFIRARIFNADRIIGERLGWMEVENKCEISSIAYDHFIIFMFPAHIGLNKIIFKIISNSLNLLNPSVLNFSNIAKTLFINDKRVKSYKATYRMSMQPSIFLFECIYSAIPIVHVFVLK